MLRHRSEDLAPAEAWVKPEEPTRIDPMVVDSPLEEPMLALQLKKLDLELSCWQYQARLLQFQTLELETKKEIKLKELALRNRPAPGSPVSPAPALPVPVHQS